MSRELTAKVAAAKGQTIIWPRYSENIAAAWPLFEQLEPGWQLSQADSGWDDEHRWWCWLPSEYCDVAEDAIYMAPTPAEAICLAFLAAMEGRDE